MTDSSRPAFSRLAARYLAGAGLAAAAAAALWPGQAQADFHYRGSTSQHRRVSFQVPDSFSNVRKVDVSWAAKCTSGATLTERTYISRIPLRWVGLSVLQVWRSQGSYGFNEVDLNYSNALGRQLGFVVRIRSTGKLSDSPKGSGVWRAAVTVTDPASGQIVDTCSTGRVTWKASLIG